MHQGLKITGKTILSTKDLNWPDCAVACFDNSECNFWTHRQNSERKNLCVLRSSASENGGKRESGSISGQKACGKFGVDVLSSANLVHVNKISLKINIEKFLIPLLMLFDFYTKINSNQNLLNGTVGI